MPVLPLGGTPQNSALSSPAPGWTMWGRTRKTSLGMNTFESFTHELQCGSSDHTPEVGHRRAWPAREVLKEKLFKVGVGAHKGDLRVWWRGRW